MRTAQWGYRFLQPLEKKSVMNDALQDSSPPWDQAAFSAELATLRSRLREAEHDPERDVELLVQDLGTAYEELRAASEEVQSQREHISVLVEGHRLLSRDHERMVSTLPIPLLATDRRGVIRSANAAAAALVGSRPARLVGKPIITFFAPEDRSSLRQLLNEQARSDRGIRQVVTLMPRDGRRLRVEVFASALPEESGELTWVLASEVSGVVGVGAEHLPQALVRLATLASPGASTQDVLTEAVRTCEDALGAGIAVSLSIGTPLEPTAVATCGGGAQSLDGAQLMFGEGPSVSAFHGRVTVRSHDIASDERWPRLSQGFQAGTHSVVCVPVEVLGEVVGTLTVYAEPAVGDGVRSEVVELFAAAVAAALHEVRLRGELDALAADLDKALASRAVIDLAKGIVMVDKSCGPDAAFQHLVDLSSSSHQKLRDVAQAIVDRVSGQEPCHPDRGSRQLRKPT